MSSRPSASSPACGSSSSHSSARRATRQASAVRRRWPADSRRDRERAQPPREAEPVERRVDLVADAPTVAPQNRTFSATVRSRYSPFVAEQRRRAGARRSDRCARSQPSTRAAPAGRAARVRRTAAATSSCRRRSARGADDLARSTASVTPASAGNRPSTATASSSRRPPVRSPRPAVAAVPESIVRRRYRRSRWHPRFRCRHEPGERRDGTGRRIRRTSGGSSGSSARSSSAPAC